MPTQHFNKHVNAPVLVHALLKQGCVFVPPPCASTCLSWFMRCYSRCVPALRMHCCMLSTWWSALWIRVWVTWLHLALEGSWRVCHSLLLAVGGVLEGAPAALWCVCSREGVAKTSMGAVLCCLL